MVIRCDTEFQCLIHISLTEESRLARFIRQYPHFHGDVLTVPIAFELRGEEVILSVQADRYGVVGLCAVTNARHFEIVVRQISFGYLLIEVEPDVIIDGQHAVCRLCAAEESRIIHIFDTAVYLRHVLHLHIIYKTDTHCTDIVVLVLHIIQHPLVFDCSGISGIYHFGIQTVCYRLIV